MRVRTTTAALRCGALGWALCLAACQPTPPPPPVPVAPLSVRAGSVSISGDDALAAVLSWSPATVVIEPGGEDAAHARAQAALDAGDLFETPESALPIWLALRQAGDPRAGDGLERARTALLEQGDAALALAGDDLDALRAAQRRGAVAQQLWPGAPSVAAYQARVDLAGRIWDLNAAGEAALAAGALDAPDGGAVGAFRQALALAPGQARARQGLAAVESAYLRRAELAALVAGDFPRAQREIERAGAVRGAPQTVADGRERVEALRAQRVRRLRDEGLIALGDSDGLRVARERLGEILQIAKPGDPAARELRERIDLATHYGLFRPRQTFTDGLKNGSRGPQLVVVPHGAFRMGAPENERDAKPEEQPQHYVRLERGFAMSRTEITVGEFGRFVQATGFVPRADSRGHSLTYDRRSGAFVRASGVSWRSTYDGRPAAGDLPVVHVSAQDAEAYARWLSEETGAHYRLPSEAEFEYALRAGTQARFPWGEGAPPAGTGNLTGARDVSRDGRRWANAFAGYGDGHWGPAPVASFKPNAYGLHDMAGNVSEWVADCWHAGYRRAPATGAAWVNPGCRTRMYRGGSWASAPEQVRAAWRSAGGTDITNARVGFRVVRQL